MVTRGDFACARTDSVPVDGCSHNGTLQFYQHGTLLTELSASHKSRFEVTPGPCHLEARIPRLQYNFVAVIEYEIYRRGWNANDSRSLLHNIDIQLVTRPYL
ncbi:hypothetical protein PISMIDRAFT_347936 [Pisolithus microcarpus 441]|uniref:Uncharacterized protein n=1 Tax=Pisolithus microcarpus 441 TaxID=765257 RepID=A0A0C9YWQ2_9AGAM|nr:hypothetical protein PISMIDRAFT_347936 [Pisolithus microcarpus 441]